MQRMDDEERRQIIADAVAAEEDEQASLIPTPGEEGGSGHSSIGPYITPEFAEVDTYTLIQQAIDYLNKVGPELAKLEDKMNSCEKGSREYAEALMRKTSFENNKREFISWAR